jgi:hypothetical protein
MVTAYNIVETTYSRRIHVLCYKSFNCLSAVVGMDVARCHPTAANSACLIEGECLSPCIALPCLFSAPLPDLPATSPHGHAPPSCSGPTSHVPPGFSTAAIPRWICPRGERRRPLLLDLMDICDMDLVAAGDANVRAILLRC